MGVRRGKCADKILYVTFTQVTKSFKILHHSTSTFQKYVLKQDFMILL